MEVLIFVISYLSDTSKNNHDLSVKVNIWGLFLKTFFGLVLFTENAISKNFWSMSWGSKNCINVTYVKKLPNISHQVDMGKIVLSAMPLSLIFSTPWDVHQLFDVTQDDSGVVAPILSKVVRIHLKSICIITAWGNHFFRN